MASVRIYTKTHCPYSLRAKRLLQSKGIAFEEIDIQEQPDRREEMIEAAGGRSTVPQVFIAQTHVGGCDDLQSLDERGELDRMFAQDSGASA